MWGLAARLAPTLFLFAYAIHMDYLIITARLGGVGWDGDAPPLDGVGYKQGVHAFCGQCPPDEGCGVYG